MSGLLHAHPGCRKFFPYLCIVGAFSTFDVGFDGGEAFGADVVFHFAGVAGGGFGGDAEGDQPVGDQGMAFVDGFGAGAAGFGQGDVAGVGDFDEAVLAKVFHGYADAGFGIAEFVYDIDGTDIWQFFAQHQDGFEIIFDGFFGFMLLV